MPTQRSVFRAGLDHGGFPQRSGHSQQRSLGGEGTCGKIYYKPCKSYQLAWLVLPYSWLQAGAGLAIRGDAKR